MNNFSTKESNFSGRQQLDSRNMTLNSATNFQNHMRIGSLGPLKRKKNQNIVGKIEIQ